jgi:hypothetical protein
MDRTVANRPWYSCHVVSLLAALTAALIIVALDFPWGLRSRPYTRDSLRLGITAVSAGLLILLVLEHAIRKSSWVESSKVSKQFHLSSAIAVLVLFGTWLMLNTISGEISHGGEHRQDVKRVGRITRYGWPLASYRLFSPRFTDYGGGKFEALAPELTASSLRSVSLLEFLCNVLIYCLAVVIAVSILEQRII